MSLASTPDLLPFVSVIMPVRNEAEWIARSLGAVLRQDYPATRMEIIVADGLSEDDTVAVMMRLPGRDGVRIISNPARLQAAGLNQALLYAQGDVIVRIDGHTVVAPDYVRRIVAALQATGAECVGGSINAVGQTNMGRAIAVASKSPFAVPAHFRVSTTPGYVDTVYMGAWLRNVFERIGGFDEQLAVNEDYEFNYRLRHAGGSIFFTPDVCSQYHGKETLRALARQYFRYGLWKPAMIAKHPGSLQPRQVIAPAFVLGLVVFLFALTTPQTALWGALIPGLYLLVNLLFSLRSGRRWGWKILARIPWVFATIHLAWGVSFWIGTCRLLARRSGRSLS